MPKVRVSLKVPAPKTDSHRLKKIRAFWAAKFVTYQCIIIEQKALAIQSFCPPSSCRYQTAKNVGAKNLKNSSF